MDGIANFSNTAIQSQDLPQLQQLNFERLSPKYTQSNRYINLFSTAIIM